MGDARWKKRDMFAEMKRTMANPAQAAPAQGMPGTFDPTNDAPAVATHSHKIKGKADIFEHVIKQMNTVSDVKMRLR